MFGGKGWTDLVIERLEGVGWMPGRDRGGGKKVHIIAQCSSILIYSLSILILNDPSNCFIWLKGFKTSQHF